MIWTAPLRLDRQGYGSRTGFMVFKKQFFKFHRRFVSEGGMQTFAVVHFLNEKGKPNLNVFHGPVFPKVDFYNLERFEKAFSGSVVIRIFFAGNADQKSVL
jgi:hypothetical protein